MSQTVVEIKALKDRDTAAALDSLGTTIAGIQAGTSNTTQLKLAGATSGTITVKAAAVAGTNTVTLPAGTTDFSATGGTSQVLKQTSAGGAITVAQLAASDISNGTSGSGAIALVSSPSLTDPITNMGVVSTSTLTKNTDTTFAVIPGMTVSLAAGKTYIFWAHLTITAANASGGIKVTMATPDTLTATSTSFTAVNYNGTTTNAQSTATALGSAVGGATAVATDVYIEGAIVVNAAGTLQVQAAQNASFAANTTVGVNSVLMVQRIN